MPDVTVRDLSEETYRVLQVRATEHARSVEAEILFIIEEVMRPKDRVKIRYRVSCIWAADWWPLAPKAS